MFVAGILGGSQIALALEVREVRWGFNGTIQRNTFNICTIDLINPTSEAFEGPIELVPVGSFSRGNVTPWMELNVYIAAGESRTIQFAPLITSEMPEWRLKWGSANSDRFDFPNTKKEIQSPVTVQFRAEQQASPPMNGLEVFDERDFPIGAAGTELLGSVVLDHVPRWDEVRTRSFRDWLGRGGQLYLINDRDGKPLPFPAALEELNVLSDRFQIGQGTVTRHAPTRDAAEISGLVPHVGSSDPNPVDPMNSASYANSPVTDGVAQLFQTLRNMVRPDHNWSLIFLLALLYLLILFPGIWLFSRKRGDYRVTYALILGTVLMFSWFYAEIGKRGYNESTGLRQMMVAYPLGNQRIALQKYSSLFVTDGGVYPIAPHGEGAIFALGSTFEFSGSASFINRPMAGMVADIPPFSACSFMESSVLPTQGDYEIRVPTLEVTPNAQRIEVVLGASIPSNCQVFFVTGDICYALTHNGTVWENKSPPLPVSAQFPLEHLYAWSRPETSQLQRNLTASLVQIALSKTLTNQYQYGEQIPAAVDPSASVFESGHVLAIAEAPPELLPTEFSASGQVLFVQKVDASMATSLPLTP